MHQHFGAAFWVLGWACYKSCAVGSRSRLRPVDALCNVYGHTNAKPSYDEEGDPIVDGIWQISFAVPSADFWCLMMEVAVKVWWFESLYVRWPSTVYVII